MIRLMTAGLCALALAACTAETPDAPTVATDADCKLVLAEPTI